MLIPLSLFFKKGSLSHFINSQFLVLDLKLDFILVCEVTLDANSLLYIVF
jgi:hypothetical protein